eukprot:1147947-Pelagomonas_calceolata.AAC.1
MSTSNEKQKWMVLDDDGKQKHVGGAPKPHDLLAKLKTGSHPWDGKLYPVIREEYGGVCVCAGMQGMQAASQR